MIAAVMIISFVLAGPGFEPCPDGDPIGFVVGVLSVDGQPVEIRRSGETSWMKAEEGMSLCVGDQVRSRFRSKALVQLEFDGSDHPMEVVVGVNARIRTMGAWHADPAAPDDPPVLDIVHGVVALTGRASGEGSPYYVRTGPTVCRFDTGRVYSNWDPFKREANHLVDDGGVSCKFHDSTVVVHRGESLEVISGKPQVVRQTILLLLDAFSKATRFP